MEEDKLSRIIKQKLENQAPPYKEAYWEQASAQMAQWDQEQKRKRRAILWWWLAGICLLLGVGTFTYFQWNQSKTEFSSDPALTSLLTPLSPDSSDLSLNGPRQKKAQSPTQSSSLPFSPSNSEKTTSTQRKPDNKGAQKVLSLNALRNTEEPKTSLHQDPPARISPRFSRKNRDFLLGVLPARFASLDADIGLPSLQPIEEGSAYPTRPSISLTLGRGSWGQLLDNAEQVNPDAWKQDYSIGTEAMMPLKHRLYLQSGLHYVSQALQDIQLNAEARTFSFSYEDQQLTWRPVQASSLWMPLRVGYFLAPGHRIEAGLALQYLLGSRGSALTQTVDGFGNQSQQTESLNGIRYGMRTWGLGAQIGYKIHLKGRFHAGLQYHYDLRDLTRDDAFQPEQVDANRGLRLTLEYIIR